MWYYEYVCLTDLDLLDKPGGELLLPDLDARGLAVVARLHALLVVQAQHLTPTTHRKTHAHTRRSDTEGPWVITRKGPTASLSASLIVLTPQSPTSTVSMACPQWTLSL
jgi:hypothetical protein